MINILYMHDFFTLAYEHLFVGDAGKSLKSD